MRLELITSMGIAIAFAVFVLSAVKAYCTRADEADGAKTAGQKSKNEPAKRTTANRRMACLAIVPLSLWLSMAIVNRTPVAAVIAAAALTVPFSGWFVGWCMAQA